MLTHLLLQVLHALLIALLWLLWYCESLLTTAIIATRLRKHEQTVSGLVTLVLAEGIMLVLLLTVWWVIRLAIEVWLDIWILLRLGGTTIDIHVEVVVRLTVCARIHSRSVKFDGTRCRTTVLKLLKDSC